MEKTYILTEYGLDPKNPAPQTERIQKVLDLAGRTGGRVIFPRGEYVTGGLRLYGNTEVHLERGARLLGSADPADYPVFDLPAGHRLMTDAELIPGYFIRTNVPRPEYRRAIFSAYGAENLAITGEGADSVIDGQDCFDPEGEEGMRGPHGIFLSGCRNVRLENYVIRNSANFHHQLDANEDVRVLRVSAYGGHDGFHLHCCRRVLLDGCELYTGDDCVAGINVEDLTLVNSTLNTSCQLFRIGGKHLHVENCRMFGPGVYPYRRSIMVGPNEFLPLTEGKHNISSFMQYFASTNLPMDASEDVTFKNCAIENVDNLLWYRHDVSSFDGCHFCAGTPLRELTFDHVRISGLKEASEVTSAPETPLVVRFIGVTCTDENGDPIAPFAESSENLIFREE